MKYTAWIVLLSAILAIACKKSDKKDCPADTYTYTFLNDAKLDSVRVGGVSTVVANTGGAKRAFVYRWDYTTCPEIADGDHGHSLLFEVNPALTYFKYPADSFRAIRCSFCPYNSYGMAQAVTTPASGTIEGTKINDNQWKLSIDVTINASQRLQVVHDFYK